MCEMERGNAEGAVTHFQQGLELPDLTAAARHSLQFELGAAYETQGLPAEALEQYLAIQAEDGTFRDVSERVQRLGGSVKAMGRSVSRPAPKPAAAPRRLAAQFTGTPATASRDAGGGGGPSDSGPDTPRKNRKIGFV
jgi:hypothetical protein